MKREINFGIGFITGRPNVCRIVNNYYKLFLEQVKLLKNTNVVFTIFILYDLSYQHTTRTDFYGILPEVYKNMNIKYITPEDIEEDKKKLISINGLTKEEADLLIGKGYAKARNAILYYALKRDIDYLLFWDDDEYPIANVKTEKEILWKKQYNILEHIKNIENVDITCGYRCGMMNPIPYIEYNENVKEEDYKAFIDGLENDAISWDNVQKNHKNKTCISYADLEIAEGKKGIEIIHKINDGGVLYGSGMCINLKHIDKIPAFYNPPDARGEDTFFFCALEDKGSRILKIPTYHFHDSFLKFTNLMKDSFPKTLRAIALDEYGIEQRFAKTAIGWTRYKPLLYYITDRENYKNIIKQTRTNLKKSVPKINTVFETCDFNSLIKELDEYDKNVIKHYEEYRKVTEVWDKLVKNIRERK